MITTKKKNLITIACTVLCLGVVPVVSQAAQQDADKVLAQVGSQKITQADITAKVSMLPPQFRARYETPEGTQKLLDQTIKFTLLSQEARSLGIDKQEDVAKKIKEISDNIIIQELTKQEIMDKVTVSDQETETYYNENKQDFIKPEKVKVNLILFEVKDGDGADVKAEKKKSAEAALKRLQAGEEIEALAKELSDDKRTQKRGGSTGFFSRGKRKNTYGQIFEDRAFSLNPGDSSGVFEDKRGYYIIKVADKKPQHEQSLAEVKQKIERRLKQQKQKESYDAYIENLKKKYPVQIFH